MPDIEAVKEAMDRIAKAKKVKPEAAKKLVIDLLREQLEGVIGESTAEH